MSERLTPTESPGNSPPELPRTLESPTAKLIYLYLSITISADVEDIHTHLQVPLLELFPLLETLIDRKLIEHQDGKFVLSDTTT